VIKEAGWDFDLLDIGLYDYDDGEVENYLASNRYDVVLTGSIVTHYKWMKWLTHTIRRHQPEATIVVGNSVGGSIPELFLEHGHITDENAFLDSITERQDICLNMTSMSDEEILEEITARCGRLNEKLDLGLSEDSYVRTGGYRKHTKGTQEPRRNQGDVSFNYSNQLFDMGPDGE
jgi:hypothetical protein